MLLNEVRPLIDAESRNDWASGLLPDDVTLPPAGAIFLALRTAPTINRLGTPHARAITGRCHADCRAFGVGLHGARRPTRDGGVMLLFNLPKQQMAVLAMHTAYLT
jgi:hypothetical protein